MKKIATILLLMLATAIASTAAKAQNVNIPQGKTVTLPCKLNSVSYGVDPTGTTFLLSYDMQSQEITLRIALERGEADHLWIPSKSYDDQMLKEAVDSKLSGKVSMDKAFKRVAVFGISPVFEYKNCKPVATKAVDIKEELYGRKDTALFRFTVDDPHSTVALTLRSLTPVKTTETASGRTRYTFMYVADKINLEITVPTDPCEEDATLMAANIINTMADTLQAATEKMSQASKQHIRKDCLAQKRRMDEELLPRVDTLRTWYASLGIRCATTEAAMGLVDSIITVATDMQCPKAAPRILVPPTPPTDPEPPLMSRPIKEIVMAIKKHAEGVDKCIDNIRNNKDVDKNRTNGKRRISEANKYIDSLDDKAKEDPQVKSAIKMFESAVKSFRRFQ